MRDREPAASRSRVAVALVAILTATGTTRAQPSFQGTGALPAANFGSRAVDISEDGAAVLGNSDVGVNSIAFRWQAGVITSMGDLPGMLELSEAGGISSNGGSVSGMSFSVNGTEAFHWESGVIAGLGDLPGGPFYSHAFEISGDGNIVVGLSRTDVADFPFRWEGGVMTNLSMDFAGEIPPGHARTISDDGQVIVGHISTTQGGRMFRWQAGTMEAITFPPDSVFASARSVSADGSVIVGHVRFSGSHTEAFRWQDGTYQMLGDLAGGALDSEARDTSADGSIVVGVATAAAGPRPFIWDADREMRNLDDELRQQYGLDLTDWILTEAVGISGDGLTIAGNGFKPAGSAEAWIAHIGCAVGDLDNDGVCTPADVPRLVACLTAGAFCGCADVNPDGTADARDVAAFVSCVLQGP